MSRREGGYALVEAMIGAAIIAITLASMYEAILESARRNRMAEDRRTALMIAQSELATVGTLVPATPGITDGTAGDYYWRVDIEPYTMGPGPSIAGQLCTVTVVVSDVRRAPLATLTTLTLTRGA